jgi:hypothetical protein
MTKTKLTALLTAAVAGTLLLAGCTQPTPTPTATKTHTASATPSAVLTIAPAQQQVQPPANKDAALHAAQKTADAFLKYDFQLQADPSLGAHFLDNYIYGSGMQQIVADTVTHYQEQGWYATGKPIVFSPDMGASYTAQGADAAGSMHDNWVSNLVGCADKSGVTIKAKTGSTPPPSAAVGSQPGQFTVQYIPNLKVWKVTGESSPQRGLTC